jgi:cytochrome c oxidase subunit 2
MRSPSNPQRGASHVHRRDPVSSLSCQRPALAEAALMPATAEVPTGTSATGSIAQPTTALHWNLPDPATATGHQVYDMHMMVTLVCALIGLVVFASMTWAIVRWRRSEGAVAARFSHHAGLEVLWTLVPTLILVAMAIPTTRTLLAINRTAAPAVTVRITGSQWKWHYAYPDLRLAFYSNLKSDSREASRKGSGQSPAAVPNYLTDVDRPLVLPTGQDIQLQLGSDDVIHSWWVPAFGFKRDAIPGYLNLVDINIERPGWYRGQCAELCGAGHAYMPIVVHAVPPAQFEGWVAQEQRRQAAELAQAAGRPWTRDEAMTQGQETYETICAACHQKDGKGIPGTFPALAGSAVATGPLRAHLKIVVHGSQRNPVMRAFGKELSDLKLAGVITYERNAWGNDTGDLVTPDQVGAAR